MRDNKDIKFSISKTSNRIISIRVYDELSGIEFVDAEMELENFAELITGLSYVPAKAEIRGLEYVGKKKESLKKRVECPIHTYSREDLRAWLIENCQEEGWMLDPYLGSQSSIQYKDNKTILQYAIYRYVDVD